MVAEEYEDGMGLGRGVFRREGGVGGVELRGVGRGVGLYFIMGGVVLRYLRGLFLDVNLVLTVCGGGI